MNLRRVRAVARKNIPAAIALAEHGANLHTAKITTLGERVEDVFLISGGDLRQSSRRIQLETELMERLKIQA